MPSTPFVRNVAGDAATACDPRRAILSVVSRGQ